MDRVVKIELLGQTYTLRTSTEESKVQAAANLVEAKLEEYQAATRSNIKLDMAVLAALDIANEYLQLKDSAENIKERLEARSRAIIKTIEAEI
ncbi:MAG: cell division protein ZapA [Deltaproteobacteria bacterium]|nr:cell division protein ZapA [Deltaproteobacteria bacterium]